MKKLGKMILCALPGLVLSIGVKTVFAPCFHADGSVSACAACGESVFYAGIAWVLCVLLRFCLRNGGRIVMDAVLLMPGVCGFLLPILLKTCMMQSMRCNTLMKPAAWLISLIEILLAAVVLIRDIRGKKEKKHE